MPVRVLGHDTNGASWEEMASVRDASPSGVALNLRHPITRGQVLLLMLPLPKRFRRYDLGDASYRIYGLVRGVQPDSGLARVGVMFLGRHPPRDFDRNPGGLYLLPSDPPPTAAATDRRKAPRIDVYVNLRIRRVADDGSGGRREEQTIAENIGRNGARVLTSLNIAKGEIVEVQEVDGPFRARAEVRNAYVGDDRIPRLNLCFLDTEAPARLVQSL
jgi:hypothetical protein